MRPDDPESLIDEERFGVDEFMPYWAELWPSGIALARHVVGLPLDGVRALELGCGLGLPSLAAALAGAETLATDWAPEAVELLRENAAANGLGISTAVLDSAVDMPNPFAAAFCPAAPAPRTPSPSPARLGAGERRRERRQPQPAAELEHPHAVERHPHDVTRERDPARPQLGPVRHELVDPEALLVDEALRVVRARISTSSCAADVIRSSCMRLACHDEEAARRAARGARPGGVAQPGAGARDRRARPGLRQAGQQLDETVRARGRAAAAVRLARRREARARARGLPRRPSGKDCLDVGASTGGFTDCLLQAARRG